MATVTKAAGEKLFRLEEGRMDLEGPLDEEQAHALNARLATLTARRLELEQKKRDELAPLNSELKEIRKEELSLNEQRLAGRVKRMTDVELVTDLQVEKWVRRKDTGEEVPGTRVALDLVDRTKWAPGDEPGAHRQVPPRRVEQPDESFAHPESKKAPASKGIELPPFEASPSGAAVVARATAEATTPVPQGEELEASASHSRPQPWREGETGVYLPPPLEAYCAVRPAHGSRVLMYRHGELAGSAVWNLMGEPTPGWADGLTEGGVGQDVLAAVAKEILAGRLPRPAPSTPDAGAPPKDIEQWLGEHRAASPILSGAKLSVREGRAYLVMEGEGELGPFLWDAEQKCLQAEAVAGGVTEQQLARRGQELDALERVLLHTSSHALLEAIARAAPESAPPTPSKPPKKSKGAKKDT